MGRTLRAKAERSLLFRAAEGRCQLCGCELGSDWHADHIVPWSVSKRTNVFEMQATCPKCNLKKGAKIVGLRKWQAEAWRKSRTAKADFSVEATPGSGKTKLACHIAKTKLDEGSVRRIIVVVPFITLKEQWEEALKEEGIHAEPNVTKIVPWPPSDFNAMIVTYQQVMNNPTDFAYLCRQSDTMVIFDEIHHCAIHSNGNGAINGKKDKWGDNLKVAFSEAKYRLLLSGTPFRSDNAMMPFAKYNDAGVSVFDSRYGYEDALRDGVCRHIWFPRQGGKAEWVTPKGEVFASTFDDELEDAAANQRLRTALMTGDWIDGTLRDAHCELMEFRQTDPDAGGLVLAMNLQHANEVSRKIRQITGQEPECVTSDDDDAQNKIKRFRNSSQPWIVAVRMVSEGVDIKRLRVGVYATNYTTEMFFRQVVGRFVRVESDHDDHTASLYIPDDPRLRSYAERIKELRDAVWKEQDEEDIRQSGNGDTFDMSNTSLFTPLDSTLESRGRIIEDWTFTSEQLDIAANFAGGKCRPEVAATILMKAGFFSTKGSAKPETATPDDGVMSKSDERKALREKNARIAKRLKFTLNREYSHINRELNDHVGVTKIDRATIDQLRRRLEYGIRWLERASG